jgi:hypothetical protein
MATHKAFVVCADAALLLWVNACPESGKDHEKQRNAAWQL